MDRAIYCQKMSKNGSVTLENSKGSLLKKKYNAALSKPYTENASGQEVDEKDFVAEKMQQKRILTICLIRNFQTLNH